MNKCQRKRIPWFVIPCAAVCLLHGQLSTRAGLIYYVEGDVRLDGIRVAKFDPLVRVGAGRTLDTGPDTLAELLLQPGNYFRLAGNTAVTMKSDEFASVAMELNGSATLDVSAIDPKTGIVISCGQASAEFSRPGFYRLDCGGGDGTSSIHVFRGQATFSNARI